MLVGGRLRAHIVPLAVSVHFIPYVSRCTYSLGDNPVIDAVPLSLEKFRAVQVVSLCFLSHASRLSPHRRRQFRRRGGGRRRARDHGPPSVDYGSRSVFVPRPGRAPQTPDAAGDVVRNSSLVACDTVLRPFALYLCEVFGSAHVLPDVPPPVGLRGGPSAQVSKCC